MLNLTVLYLDAKKLSAWIAYVVLTRLHRHTQNTVVHIPLDPGIMSNKLLEAALRPEV